MRKVHCGAEEHPSVKEYKTTRVLKPGRFGGEENAMFAIIFKP
jgi:hypothetical protein